jgi:hypothetical protein
METKMSDSVYKIIEVVGTSKTSWEDATKNAVKAAGLSVRDLRIAEITKLDTVIDKGEVVAFRARVSLSFKYDTDTKKKAKTKAK